MSMPDYDDDPALENTAPATLQLALQLQISREELVQLVRDTLPEPTVPGLPPPRRGPLLTTTEMKDQAVGRLVRVVVRTSAGGSEARVCRITGMEERDDCTYLAAPDLETRWLLQIEHAGRYTATKLTLVNSGLFKEREVAIWADSATAPRAGRCEKRWRVVRGASKRRREIMTGKRPWPNNPVAIPTVVVQDDGVEKITVDGKVMKIGNMTQPELVRLVKKCQAVSRHNNTKWRDRWDQMCDDKCGSTQRDPAKKSKDLLMEMLLELGDPTQKGPLPDPRGADFCASNEFVGRIEGYYFAREAAGQGYHKDWRQREPDLKRPRYG